MLLSRVQLYTVPATLFGLLKVMVAILFPEQIVCVAGVAATVGTGLTITFTVIVVDTQLSSEVAIIVNVVVCWAFVVLVKVPVIDDPLALAGIPVRLAVLFLVQL